MPDSEFYFPAFVVNECDNGERWELFARFPHHHASLAKFEDRSAAKFVASFLNKVWKIGRDYRTCGHCKQWGSKGDDGLGLCHCKQVWLSLAVVPLQGTETYQVATHRDFGCVLFE